MAVYSQYNGIKQVFNGNLIPDLWTENKPTAQLLQATEVVLTLREWCLVSGESPWLCL